MEKSFKTLATVFGLLLSCWACIEIHPIKPNELPISSGSRSGSTTVCQAPSIEKNIVGTWHFESTYNIFQITNPDTVITGTVTFTAEKTIIDPNSLFVSQVVDGPVISKIYEPNKPMSLSNYTGDVFEVTVKSRGYGFETDYFTVVSNECNRIHIRQFLSVNNGIGFVLTRL